MSDWLPFAVKRPWLSPLPRLIGIGNGWSIQTTCHKTLASLVTSWDAPSQRKIEISKYTNLVFYFCDKSRTDYEIRPNWTVKSHEAKSISHLCQVRQAISHFSPSSVPHAGMARPAQKTASTPHKVKLCILLSTQQEAFPLKRRPSISSLITNSINESSRMPTHA